MLQPTSSQVYENLSLQELIEKDREDAKDKAMQGKEVTFEFGNFFDCKRYFLQVTRGEKIVKKMGRP